MPSLRDPVGPGAIVARNRILMVPPTRGRPTREHVPTPIMVYHHAQRAGTGLIISEVTGISRQDPGWPDAPGIRTDAQAEAWRPVTEAVRQTSGSIACQPWPTRRVVHPSFAGGVPPVSASANEALDHVHAHDGRPPDVEARALEADEIPSLLENLRRAACDGRSARLDAVQIHAANGYLIDQFPRNNSNQRQDSQDESIRTESGRSHRWRRP